MKKRIFAVLICLIATAAFAQGALPPGKWWRQPRVIQHLGLSEDQQERLDSIFRANAAELIDLKAEAEKRTLALRNEMDQPQVNRQAVQRAAASVAQAHGRLFEREMMMFVDMRTVLSPDQWSRFRHVLDARDRMHRGKRSGRGETPLKKRP